MTVEPNHLPVKEWMRTIGALTGILALGLAMFLIVSQVQNNKRSIEKGCVLLNNAVIKSQRASARPDSSTAILVKAILEGATPATRQKFAEAAARESKRPNPLIVPCVKVAEDPESIKAIPVTTAPLTQTTTTTTP